MAYSKHLKNDRQERFNVLDNVGGFGNEYCQVLIKHQSKPNEYQCHVLTDNGIIKVYSLKENGKRKKMVTFFLARPSQLKRFNQRIEKSIVDKCRNYQNKGYNLI